MPYFLSAFFAPFRTSYNTNNVSINNQNTQLFPLLLPQHPLMYNVYRLYIIGVDTLNEVNKDIVVKPKLLKILNDRNITQQELAEITGVPQGSISRFDRNERHAAKHLFLIAHALDVSIEDLFHVES